MSVPALHLSFRSIPPSLYSSQRWKIKNILNPDYKCGAPLRVSPTEFPNKTGLDTFTVAVTTWQVVCNIAKPKSKNSCCCVSFFAFYNDTIIPCSTCSCNDTSNYNSDTDPLLLPFEALLIPFDNHTTKANAWAKIKHYHVPAPLPCPDNCGVNINWHVFTDYRKGWTARITLFNDYRM